MTAPQEPAEEPEEPSRTAGACVLIVLSGMAVAVVFAFNEAAGVLTVVASSTVALWRTARRMSDSSATPPPPSGSTVYAGHRDEIARIQEGPGEGLLILYPVAEEEVTEP